MRIDRTKLISELTDFGLAGHGIIVGPPGVGKSYAIAELREELRRRGTPHLILPVERLGDGSEADVSAFLKKKGDFVALLSEAGKQHCPKRGLLIFDGFDAARGERQREG